MPRREQRRATVIEVLYRAEVEFLETVGGDSTYVRLKGDLRLYALSTSVLDKFADERGW